MRTWGPAVLILVVLAVFLVWAQCGEEPIVGYDAVSTNELRPIAEKILGAQPRMRPWSGEDHTRFSVNDLDQALNELVGAVAESRFDRLRRRDSYARLESAITASATKPPGSGDLADTIAARLTMARLALATGDRSGAAVQLGLAASISREAVETATSVEQWEQSQIARLRFLELAPVVMRSWSRTDLAAMTNLAQVPDHRAALGRTLVFRFIDDVVPEVAAASERERPSHAVAHALFGSEDAEEERLIAGLLHRHPRAFSPEQTVEAGAESLRQLREALALPWVNAREVLDLIRETQAFWLAFQSMMEMGEEDASSQVKELALQARSLENPVGLAVLQSERLSWSGLVQSAYVADAKEAAFLYLVTGSAPDPISGGSLTVEDGQARFTSEGNDAYPFIKALTEAPVKARL